MPRELRYCRRCGTDTEQIRAPRAVPRTRGRLDAYLVELIARLRRDRWECTVCLRGARPRRKPVR